jgi:flagellar hook-associated protein 2
MQMSVSSTSSSTSSTTSSVSSVTGLDYDALVATVVAAKSTRADSIDVQITENEAKVAAYEEGQTLLATLTTAADALTATVGYSTSSSDLFEKRTAYLSGASNASSLLGVTVDDGTQEGSYSVEIKQLAEAQKISSGTQTSSTDDLGLTGSFTIASGSGTAKTITITESSSLTDIASAINSGSSASGVSASILKVSDSDYRLILTATDTGQEITFGDETGSVLSSLGLTDTDGNIANELTAAQSAIIVIDGVEITRDSNTISDALDGITLDLYGAEEGTTLTVEVDTDLSAVKDGITALVDAYNDVREYLLTQQNMGTEDSDDEDTSTSALFADSLLRQISTSISTALNYSYGETSIATLGLSFDENNKLVLDEDVLDDALISSLDDVKSLLSFNMESSSTDLSILRRPSSLSADDFTLDITVDESGSITGVSVDGDSSKFTISGTRISGVDGTEYAGLVFVYTGDTASVDVKLTTGIAEMLYQTAYTASNSSDGSLQSKIDELTEYNTDLESRATDIRTKAEEYGENLRSYYARLEAKAQTAKILLDQLEASSSSDDE